MATLDRLGRALSRQLASEQVPDHILAFLNERFGWRGSSLSVQTEDASGLLFFGQAGSTEGAPSQSHPLLEGSRRLGVLDVWGDAAPDSENDRMQLEKLLPWIAMTVVNARLAAGSQGGGGLRWTSKTGHDLFLILDATTRILYAGPRVDEVLGYEAEDLQQLRVAELLHPEDLRRLAGEIGELSQSSSSAFYSRARLRMQGGDFRNMEGVAIKVLSEAGATVYLVSCSAEAEADRASAH
jgi:PAS domain S-box-containing protein